MPKPPLEFAALTGEFPAEPLLVEQYQDTHNFAKVVERFQKNRGFYTRPLEGFPDTVHELPVCKGGRGGCCKEIYDDADATNTQELKDTASHILQYIRLVLQHAKKVRSGPAAVADSIVLLRFRPRDMDNLDPLYYLVPPASNLKKENDTKFTAEFWKMLPSKTYSSTDVDGAFLPTLFIFAPGDRLFGMSWPRIEDELSITRTLHSLSQTWEISVLKSAAPSVSTRLATEATPFLYEELKAAEEAKREADRARKAVDSAMGTKEKKERKSKKPKPAHGHVGTGRAGRGLGKGKGSGRGKGGGRTAIRHDDDDDGADGRPPPPPNVDKSKRILPAESSDSASSETETEDSSTEEYWKETVVFPRALTSLTLLGTPSPGHLVSIFNYFHRTSMRCVDFVINGC